MIKAVMFDFNGTLYFDSDINEKSWHEIIDELSNKQIDFQEFYQEYKSVMDHIVIEEIFKRIKKDYNKETIEEWVQKKEEKYRELCTGLKRNQMAKGAEDVLNYLKKNHIPVILVTSSIIENVRFYYSNLKLDRWFKFEQTVYDDGTNYEKTTMYKKAANILAVDIKDTVVFEDSPKSIKEAIAAGVNKVIAIKREDTPKYKEIKQIIRNYQELDYSIFE